MSTYQNEKQMLFHYLNHYIDYSKSWEEIEFGMGYDLGYWSFRNIKSDKIRRMARQLWIELNDIHETINR